MHQRLAAQIRQFLGDNPDASPSLQSLLSAISQAYDSFDESEATAAIFRLTLDASTSAICILSMENTIMYVNQAWEKLTGYSREESMGKVLAVLWSEKTSLNMYQRIERALAERSAFASEEIIHRKKSGEEYYVQLNMYPVATGKGKPLLAVVQQDITERKISDNSKSEFVSLASHQLRTPLTSVIWNLEIMMDTDVTKMSSEQLKSILEGAHKSSKRMAETIATLMQLSNLEVGKTQPNFTYMELASLLETVRAEQLSEYLKKEQSVVIDCPRELTLFSDPILLKEILSNLLNNSVKYTPLKGTITLRAKKEGQTLIIEVEDNGYGIPTREQQKVFSKFFRGENVIYIENNGNGLGLYLVNQLVQLVRGHISFRSEESKGTTFSITLPQDARTLSASSVQEFIHGA